jgi:hypothetical protein
MPENNSKLFITSVTHDSRMLILTPLVFEGREPDAGATERFGEGLKLLLRDYLKAHGLSGSEQELSDLLEDKISEGVVAISQGLSRLTYYGIQRSLKHQ